MTQKEKRIQKVQTGKVSNISYDDLKGALEASGFVLEEGGKGSHLKAFHDAVPSILVSIQEGENGKAKPYQVRQVRDALDLVTAAEEAEAKKAKAPSKPKKT